MSNSVSSSRFIIGVVFYADDSLLLTVDSVLSVGRRIDRVDTVTGR